MGDISPTAISVIAKSEITRTHVDVGFFPKLLSNLTETLQEKPARDHKDSQIF